MLWQTKNMLRFGKVLMVHGYNIYPVIWNFSPALYSMRQITEIQNIYRVLFKLDCMCWISLDCHSPVGSVYIKMSLHRPAGLCKDILKVLLGFIPSAQPGDKPFHTTTVKNLSWKTPLIGHKNVVCQDRWSLVTGSIILQCRSFCRKCVVCQDSWPLMAVVLQERFHCTGKGVGHSVWWSLGVWSTSTILNRNLWRWLKSTIRTL